MLPFLVVFGVLGILVVCGVAVSLYLFNRGVLGKRSRRSRLVATGTSADETVTGEESDEPAIMFNTSDDETSRYARKSIFVFLGGLLVIGILLTTIINAVRH